MEYYSAVKRKALEAVLTRWMKLEPITTEWRKKEKDKYCILTHIYGSFRKTVTMILHAWQQRRRGRKEQTSGHSGGRWGRGDLRESPWNIYTTIRETWPVQAGRMRRGKASARGRPGGAGGEEGGGIQYGGKSTPVADSCWWMAKTSTIL